MALYCIRPLWHCGQLVVVLGRVNTMSFKVAEVIFLWNCLNWGVYSVYVCLWLIL